MKSGEQTKPGERLISLMEVLFEAKSEEKTLETLEHAEAIRLNIWDILLCVLAPYLLQYGVDPANLTVNEEAFLLPAVHLLDDASVLCGVHDVPHRASCHLPVIGNGRLHDGLEDCKTWRSRGRRAPSHNCLLFTAHQQVDATLWIQIAVKKSCEGILAFNYGRQHV